MRMCILHTGWLKANSRHTFSIFLFSFVSEVNFLFTETGFHTEVTQRGTEVSVDFINLKPFSQT